MHVCMYVLRDINYGSNTVGRTSGRGSAYHDPSIICIMLYMPLKIAVHFCIEVLKDIS